ncbi:hypothetical protein [Levilactobacillus fujinensis]|uniref:hypothetical protein n=1 Tax=Levilactobacillus fujinensis TaxID=2486024 RepID=UPI000F79718A|nr:hypothetical protein [Levilactobacillus fujinensis]
MHTTSRMERYHSAEQEDPQQPSPTKYQRRPALGRWVAFLILLLTVAVGLRLTLFNANYVAGVVSRSTTGEKVMANVNSDLDDLGVSGDPVTAAVIQPYLEQGIAQLYGQSATTPDSSALSTAITTQAQTLGVTASATLVNKIANQAQKRAVAAFKTPAMQTVGWKIQRAQRLDFWLLVATLLLLVVTTIYALGVHHFFGSLGPGLTLGGFMGAIVGVVGFLVAPAVVTATTTTLTSLLTSVIRSGLGVIIFAGAAEFVIGLVVLLGHRTFRKS